MWPRGSVVFYCVSFTDNFPARSWRFVQGHQVRLGWSIGVWTIHVLILYFLALSVYECLRAKAIYSEIELGLCTTAP